jgi:type IV pilus assembly protein PilQ
MTRVSTYAAMVAAFCIAATSAHALTPPSTIGGGGAVTSLSVVPATGKAEVVIGLNGTVGIQDFQLANPHRVVLDLTGATLGVPPRLYDKVARGAITNVRLAQYRENVVRVVIDLDGPREYRIVRGARDVRITIEGAAQRFAPWHSTPELASGPATSRRAANAAPVRPRWSVGPFAAAQPRITVNYQDADIRDVLAAFAAFSGRTIVVGKGVEGKITAEIRDQPWDIAMQAILQSQGLAAAEDGNGIITVDSYGQILAKQATEPLVTQLVPVNYARAATLAPTIESLLSRECLGAEGARGSNCTSRGSVRADTATNTLVITEVPSRINDLVGYVKDLDVRTPQVAIKAKIIFVKRTSIQDMGVTYDLGSPNQFFNRLVQRPDPSTFTPVDTDGDGIPDAVGGGETFDANTIVFDATGPAFAGIANASANQRVSQPALELIFRTMLGNFDLTAFINALQETQLADIQAEPSIVTLDNREASLVVGNETPVRVIDAGSVTTQTTAGVQAPRATVQFKETGIKLTVTPHITNNRQILMTLHSERSDVINAPGDLGFTIEKQAADNQLLVNDGETAVIGGLTVTKVTATRSGIPLLVDLPFIGRLFGRTSNNEEKNDLLILVTPHIVDEGEKVGSSQSSR